MVCANVIAGQRLAASEPQTKGTDREHVTTYVAIDAQKNFFIAIVMGNQPTRMT